jgi:hypothetical protein
MIEQEHQFEYDSDLNDIAIRYNELQAALKLFTDITTFKEDIRCIMVDNIQEELSDIEEHLNDFKLN